MLTQRIQNFAFNNLTLKKGAKFGIECYFSFSLQVLTQNISFPIVEFFQIWGVSGCDRAVGEETHGGEECVYCVCLCVCVCVFGFPAH